MNRFSRLLKQAAMALAVVSTTVTVVPTVHAQNVSYAKVRLPNGLWSERQEDMSVKVLGGRIRIIRQYDGYHWQINPAWNSLKFEFDNTYRSATFGCGGCGGGGSGAGVIVPAPPVTEPEVLAVDQKFGGTLIPGAVLPANEPSTDPSVVVAEYGPLYAIARNGAWFNVDSAYKVFSMTDGNRYNLKAIIPVPPPPLQPGAPMISSTTGGGGIGTGEGGSVIIPSQQAEIPSFVTGFRWEDKSGNWIEYDRKGRIQKYGDSNNITVTMVYSGDNLTSVKDHNGKTVLIIEYTGGAITAIKDNPDSGSTQPQRVVRYGYGDKGSITSVTDPMGYVTKYTYDDKGRISTITDAENRVKKLEYTATSRIKVLTAADGGKTEYTYDYNKTKKEFYVTVKGPVLPDGQRRSQFYTFNPKAQMLKMDTNGRTEVEVTLDGRNQKYVDERGLITEVRMNEFDDVTAINFPDGSSKTTTYDSLFLNVLEERDENGIANSYEYDTKGNLVKSTQAKGQPEERIFNYKLNSAGQWESATRPGKTEVNGTVTPEATWGATYDDAGNQTSITDAEGFTTTYEYDRSGNNTKVTDPKGKVWLYNYDANDMLTSIVDPLNHTTTFDYDKVGNLLKVTDGRGKNVVRAYDTQNRETKLINHYGAALTNTFDVDGRLTSRIDANGKGVKIQVDTIGRPVKATDTKGFEYSFDYTQADGLDKGGRAPSRMVYPTFERQFQYNERHKVTRQTDIAGQEGRVDNITYDRVGRTKTITDANGKTRYIDYNAFGQPVKLTDPLGNSMTMTYNVAGDLIELKDYNGNATRFDYDKRGLMTQETDQLGKVTKYSYDERGWQTDATLANGKKVGYRYDDAGRLVEQKAYTATGTVEQTVTFSYDDADNLTGWNNGSVSSTIILDDADRLSQETINYGSFSLSHAYTYYDNNQVKTYTGPDGVTITYSYDAIGQLEGVDIPNEGSISVADWTWAQPKKIVMPGGTTQEFDIDGYQSMTHLRVKNPGQETVFDLENKYGKLKEVSQRNIDGNTATYSYDDATRLTAVDAGFFNNKTETYKLDAQGNRITASKTSGNWTYDVAGQLQQRGSVTYTYDTAGNLTKKVDASLSEPTKTTNYAYDSFSRLVEVKDGNGNLVAQYTYDPFDNRLSKKVNGTTTYYLHTDNGVLAETDAAGNVQITYGWHPEHDYSTYPLYAKVTSTNGSRYVYYHNDHLGTPQRITDKAGNLVWSADYDNFGKATIQIAADPAQAVTSNLRFPGQYFDAETGLHYNDRRYYDPETGRYITRDPLGFGGGANQYLYAKHSPMNFTDPTGEILPCLAINYLRCLAVCTITDSLIQAATNCGEVDFKQALKDCALDCLLSMLPIPNPCGKFGKWAAAAAGAASAASAAGGMMNSFPADTVVHARDVQTGRAILKPIGQIKVGDEVLSWAEWLDGPVASNVNQTKTAKDAKRYEKVTDVFVTTEKVRTLVHLKLDNGKTLITTDGHPFHTLEGWRDAILLKKGGHLDIKGDDGQLSSVTIKDVKHEQRMLTTYNLEVANVHTFFVGAEGVLVHNGVIYCRTSPNPGRKPYYGKANNDKNYKERQRSHNGKDKNANYEYKEVYRGPETGKDLEKIEQGYIDRGGGPTNKSNPNGGLENKRNNFRK